MSSLYYENPYLDQPEQNVHSLSQSFICNLLNASQELLSSVELHIPQPVRDTSVYTGTAGIALLYLHLHRFFPHKNYLSKALHLADSCLRYRNNRISFLCGDPGPLAISIVAHHLSGIQPSDLIKKLTSIKFNNCPDEFLYGRSGYLYSLLFVNRYIPNIPEILETIPRVIEAILNSGLKTAAHENRPKILFYYWHDSAYIGAAHGFAGILHTLLLAKEFLTPSQLHLIKLTSDFVCELRYKSGNYQSSVGSTSDRLIQWCHGAPALIHFLKLAYHVFGEGRYFQAAIECGEITWKRGLVHKGHGICHGVAGNAYTFLALYQLTNDGRYLYRAIKFAEWCMYDQHATRTPDRPYSLFEGKAGTAYFLADLTQPNKSSFPAYELNYFM